MWLNFNMPNGNRIMIDINLIYGVVEEDDNHCLLMLANLEDDMLKVVGSFHEISLQLNMRSL